MKITTAQFNDSFPPIMDGVANTVKFYSNFLNKKYGKTYVITPHFPNYEDKESFEVIRYKSMKLLTRPPYRLGLHRFDLNVKKRINDLDLQIIHSHSPFDSGILAYNVAKQKDIPIVATFHSKFYDDFKPILKSEMLTQMVVKRVIRYFEKMDYVFTVNKSTIETLREYGYKGEVGILPTGTDLMVEANIIKDRQRINNIHNLNDNERVFLFVGQHIWQKNLKLIIESLSILKKQNFKFKMFFIGDGYARPDLIKLTNQFDLQKQVHFLGKIIDRDLLRAYYSRSDLFLFPSLYDTAGQVVKEAASMYTPSLIIKDSNASEVIDDGINGYLTKDNPQTYAKKIVEIFSDEVVLKKISEKSRETIPITWESIVDEAYSQYVDIINNHKKKKIYMSGM